MFHLGRLIIVHSLDEFSCHCTQRLLEINCTASASPLSSSDLNTPLLVQSFHPFYNSLTASSNNYTVLRPLVQSFSMLQLNRAILRTTLLLADYSESGGDINESEVTVGLFALQIIAVYT